MVWKFIHELIKDSIDKLRNCFIDCSRKSSRDLCQESFHGFLSKVLQGLFQNIVQRFLHKLHQPLSQKIFQETLEFWQGFFQRFYRDFFQELFRTSRIPIVSVWFFSIFPWAIYLRSPLEKLLEFVQNYFPKKTQKELNFTDDIRWMSRNHKEIVGVLGIMAFPVFMKYC